MWASTSALRRALIDSVGMGLGSLGHLAARLPVELENLVPGGKSVLVSLGFERFGCGAADAEEFNQPADCGETCVVIGAGVDNAAGFRYHGAVGGQAVGVERGQHQAGQPVVIER